jgi:hypothetical protein
MICGAEACKLGAMIHGAELRVHFLKSFQKGSTCENLSQKGLKNKKDGGLCLQFSVTPSICIFYELLQVMSRFFHECVCYNCKSFGNYANILTSYLLPILFPITPLLKGLLDGKATQTQLIEYALALARLRCA